MKTARKISPTPKSQQKSKYKAFFVGAPNQGAWQIRAQQISTCRTNWHCGSRVSWWMAKTCDIFVIVKKIRPKCLARIKATGKPIIYDVVDAWEQPSDSLKVTDAASALSLFEEKWRAITPDAAIFADRKMEEDLHSLVGLSTTIYHHSYPPLQPQPVRTTVKKIGYQGRDIFLADWQPILEEIAKENRVEFIINPERLEDLDIGIITRGGEYNGYLEQHYKSNVKLANMMAVGLPCMIQSGSAAYHETWNDETSYFSSESELREKITQLIHSESLRRDLSDRLQNQASNFALETIISKYEAFFGRVLDRKS
ncbi:Uncharacterised protein [BD1-7 clade bacterium]|uniref:Glycosyl transferase family 1 domain-containing protein n=1 Tax=BD1-7 clade bacterium TaxID=2029982 RepID=A0A5S9MPY8_9GAMM|nr:Uncharacterised protein [BD1-7 clade bacterium]